LKTLKFKQKKLTRKHIKKNINYLIDHNLLVEDIYKDSVPWGIFTIIRHSHDLLLKNRIGSVPVNYFTKNREYADKSYTRINVSVKNEDFTRFFEGMK